MMLRRIILAHLLQKNAGSSMDKEQAIQVMGLTPDASREEIKSAYRRLLLQYHPDKVNTMPAEVREEMTEKIKRINEAREVLEASPQNPHRPLEKDYSKPRGEDFWDNYHRRYGPKPSQKYTEADIRDFIDKVFEMGWLQFVARETVGYWPWGMVVLPGKNHYNRPVGSKGGTKRKKPEDKEGMLQLFLRQPGNIFDIGFSNFDAWVTWEKDSGREFRSLGFEPIKAAVKKQPGVGMTPAQVGSYLIEKGLVEVAGGSKYAYYSVRGVPKRGPGPYIRMGAKNMVVVTRVPQEDWKVNTEVYFGAVTSEMLDKWITYVKAKVKV